MAKKTQLGYQEIESRLKYFKDNAVAADDVPFRLLYCFGKTDAEIRRWQEGKGVVKAYDGLLIKNIIAYRTSTSIAMTADLEQMKTDPKVLAAKPKILIVSDGQTILAYDLRENDTYENRLEGLCYDFNFFYPLADVERVHNVEESPADVKAAEKLAKLHDEIRAYNEFTSDTDLHDLNIFISRLLFCYFAEDTGIFLDNLFTNSIKRYTLDDGSDLSSYLSKAFEIMDVSKRDRPKDVNSIVGQFPYVNGGLFSHHIQIPKLSARARKIMIDCGGLNWKEINPDIFGSMIQAVVNPEVRANQGMHYTSVPNIKKVINPLFMDELRSEYSQLRTKLETLKRSRGIGEIPDSKYRKEIQPIFKACNVLLNRMSQMKFFDPACGSGNFLIITYKELRLLEMDILQLQKDFTGQIDLMMIGDSKISLQQFYGIELLDFPHEVAMLSLWLAEHQMNRLLLETFGINTQALPLQNITQIKCGNACRMDWNEVCPHTQDEEVFVFGNPPYLGSRKQTASMKKDMEVVFSKYHCDYKALDYISIWFVLFSEYSQGFNARCAFVSTNSVTQGEQVGLLWPILFQNGMSIDFAYQSFKWSNNAKKNAVVTCVIISLSIDRQKKARLFSETKFEYCDNINPYLYSGPNRIISPLGHSISNLPIMQKGCAPGDGGALLLTEDEKSELLLKYPILSSVIKPFIGADELLYGYTRYCLWMNKEDFERLKSIEEVNIRVERCKSKRQASTKLGTRRKADVPFAFDEIRYFPGAAIVVPQTTSENRTYIPIFYNDSDIVYSNGVRVVFNAPFYLFGLLCSRIHNSWVQIVSGRLETRIQYSNTLCYNTFPFPKLTDAKKQEIEAAAEDVLLTREDYPGKTLADLYDPDEMPQPLREAHARLDDVVESCYPGYPFASDEARLECLFKLYEKMIKTKK
ncbi:MAG: N-6 DNA methylase [Bacteroidales bacterium]|nr:N-6 DNA methylase [Bacteroidales bacterium]